MFGVGTGEILLILVIAMLVVGPEKMVEFASTLGHMVAKLREETDSVTREFREALNTEAAQVEEGEATPEVAAAVEATGVQAPQAAVDQAPKPAPANGTARRQPQTTRQPSPAAPSSTPSSPFTDGERQVSTVTSHTASDAADVVGIDVEPDQGVELAPTRYVPENEEDEEPMTIESPVVMQQTETEETVESSEDRG
jgi:sec-independent protein translocase protein TatB